MGKAGSTKPGMKLDEFQKRIDAQKQHEVDQAILSLRHKLAKITSDYKQVFEAFESYKAANDFISQLEANYEEPKPIKPLKVTGGSESIAAAFATDWHCMEQVDPVQVNGLNAFNPTVCRKRVENFFRIICRLLEIHRSGTNIDVLVMGFLGDLMSGMLHEDQIEGNAGTPIEEALFVENLLMSGIDYLLENSGCSRIIINSVDGNHSRITEKKRKANRSKHSLEWLIFHHLRSHYEHIGEGRLEWNIADGYHLYLPIEVAGTKILRMHHGDEGIQYQGGIGGISVTANRSIDKWNKGRRADLDIFGHHHISEYPGKYVAVGSLIGYTPFSLAGKYEYEAPQQAMLLLEKKRWVTAYHKIYVS